MKPSPLPAKLNFDETLRAFLDAPDWKARSKYTLLADGVLELMEKRATTSGDSPIAYTGISLATIAQGAHLYIVRTEAFPQGMPVGVLPTEDGPKVDWETFIGFYEDDFLKFRDGPVGASGIFMLHVKPSPPPDKDKAALFLRFLLAPPMPNREQLAFLPKDSPVLAKYRAWIEGGGGLDKKEVDAAFAGDGVPMVVAVEKKANQAGTPYFIITDFIKVRWGPATKAP
ncbi:hypothetical protein [Haloferula sp. BvORR071]|uniref:hypothetical protein n=1 Tax=Haloferula sp. BvORR071 TaxID=1396141 RepID=UPI000550C7E9|nr:hypothetical protein [Haloferula sp. BvORR071]